MELTALIILATLATKFIDFLKYLRNADWNGAFTQASVWLAGVVVIFLAAEADAFVGIELPTLNVVLGDLDFASKIIVGLSITSLLSTVFDFKKALDGSDSASTPSLFPNLDNPGNND